MNHKSEPSGPDDIHSQVAAAQDQLERQAFERAGRPASKRARPGLAIIAALAMVGTLAVRLPAMRKPLLDADAQLGNTIASLETTRRVVQAYWDSTGAPPMSLDEVGLRELPFAYTATPYDFRLTAASPFGDSVGYHSPPRMLRDATR